MIIRVLMLLAFLVAAWCAARWAPVCLIYKADQRMLQDRLRQLEEVRRHEDAVSDAMERDKLRLHGGKPWK